MKLAGSLRIAALPALTALAVSGLGYAPAAHAAPSNNWHVHDGTSGPGHAPVPVGLADVLAGNGDGSLSSAERAAYLLDPLRCPDATDKATLTHGEHTGRPLRTGVCFTENRVVHLRSVEVGTPVPGGWSTLPNTETVGGVTYRTMYLITSMG